MSDLEEYRLNFSLLTFCRCLKLIVEIQKVAHYQSLEIFLIIILLKEMSIFLKRKMKFEK